MCVYLRERVICQESSVLSKVEPAGVFPAFLRSSKDEVEITILSLCIHIRKQCLARFL